MTASPDGKSLWVLLQSATLQDGGVKKTTRRYTRLLKYSIQKGKSHSHASAPVYEAEYVVPLPTFTDDSGKTAVAAQSEMHFVSDTQFLFLPRDSNKGHGMDSTQSVYRHVDVFDISGATDVSGSSHDAFNTSIASSGASIYRPIVQIPRLMILQLAFSTQISSPPPFAPLSISTSTLSSTGLDCTMGVIRTARC